MEALRGVLGEPARVEVEGGILYRWKLPDFDTHMSIYVSLNSPETPDFAHIIVSDPGAQGRPKRGEPIVSTVVRTSEEVGPVIEMIRRRIGKR